MPNFLASVVFICYIFAVNGMSVGKEEKLAEERYINKEDTERMRKEMAKRGEGYGRDWIIMPDGEGQPLVAIMKHDAGGKFLGMWDDGEGRDDAEKPYNVSQDIHYLLYTRLNPEEGHSISPDSPQSLKTSHYNGEKPTKVVIHGWKSSGDSSTVTNIKNAYLERSDVNVIGVDWSNIASNNYYLTPMGEIPNVGSEVARMIDLLWSSQGARHSDFHIIGHSLGAHVAGAAGSKTAHKVSRVTGLDPALPGFQFWQGPEGRLDETDADFVDIIHTCAGALGMSSTVGHADFYPNGGSPFQPGCCCLSEFTEACSHGRSHQYFAESVRNKKPFVASQCSTWDHFKSGSCGPDPIIMGEYTPTKTRGVYYLMTNSTAPYSLGPIGAKYSEDYE